MLKCARFARGRASRHTLLYLSDALITVHLAESQPVSSLDSRHGSGVDFRAHVK